MDNFVVHKEKTLNKLRYQVNFSGNSQSYCVGMIDMINSTKITAALPQHKISKYYEIFLNSMAIIVEKFGGFIIKNIGDSLLYYFPESSNLNRKFGFLSCLECSLKMIEEHKSINQKTYNENLPQLNYRVSADFGNVTIMKFANSSSIDIIGTPVNICKKINCSAPQNGVVVGGDLYQMVKNFRDYKFKQICECSVGLKYTYPIYSVRRTA